MQKRFEALRPTTSNISWRLGQTIEVASVPAQQMVKSSEIASEVLVNNTFASLGNKSYRDIASFSDGDQQIVDEMTLQLIAGNPRIMDRHNAEPRHALAATVFAFEMDRDAADTINKTFKHFV